MHHPQVVKLLIFNCCLKMSIYGHTRLQIVPKLLPQVSVRELHNILGCDPEYAEIEESIDAENNIIISDSTFCSLLPTKL